MAGRNCVEHVAALSLGFQSACPIPLGEVGMWADSDGSPLLRLVGGTDVDLTGSVELPPQTGHSGEFLTTNGTVASWAAVSLGNFGFTTNALDLTGAAVMTIGATTATGVTIGKAAAGQLALTATRAALKFNAVEIVSSDGSDTYLNDPTGKWALKTTLSGTHLRGADAGAGSETACVSVGAIGIGGAPALGFYGTGPQAKPTGVAVDAAGIHAALVTLGLIAA